MSGRARGLRGGAALAALCALACGPDPARVSRELFELERMAFVPAGRSSLPGYAPPFNEFVVQRALLVDLYETTLADWRHYFGEVIEDPAPAGALSGADDTWPAYFTQREARELARRRGMRLLTASEWLYCAVGPRGHPYPFGATFQTSVANTLELALGRPAAVGTFEAGRGPFGCYDQLGNVWEWVADRVPGRGDGAAVPDVAGSSSAVSVLGGSYRYRATPTFALPGEAASVGPVFNALTVAPETRSPDIGARFAADAREYLWRQAPLLGDDSEARRRLVAVGRRFGREARPLLDELARRPGAPRSLSWLAEGAAK